MLTGTQLIGMMKSGAVAGEAFVRTPESVTISGDIGIVMGRERFTSVRGQRQRATCSAPAHSSAATPTSIGWKDGRWRFLARHANVVPPSAATQPR